MAEVHPNEDSGQTILLEASKDRRSEILTEAYKGIPEASQRKLKFRCRGGKDELVNFDIFAVNSKFILNIVLSLQNVLHLNFQDPCPVILLPETSPGVIRKVERMLQTGTCVVRREEEAPEIVEVADMLGLPISGRKRSPEGSEKKTVIPRKWGQWAKSKKPSTPLVSTPKRSGDSLSRASCLSGENWMMSPVGNVTPDNGSRRYSIMSNCDTPTNVMEPVDEFLTKVGDSRPERTSHKKPLTSRNCNFDLTCEVCGKAYKTALAMDTHICAHFKEDLEVKVSCHMNEDKKCKICGDSFKTKNGLITHLGSKHGGINKVLVDKGFAVLPCRLNSSPYTDSKQQQLVKIKAERKEPVKEARQLDDPMETGVNEGTSQDVLD